MKNPDWFEDFNRRYVARLVQRQEVVNKTAVLRHPKSGYLHRAQQMEDMNREGFSGISVSLAVCGSNLPGTPPREGQQREHYHGCFDVVNLVDEPEPNGKRCKSCFQEAAS